MKNNRLTFPSAHVSTFTQRSRPHMSRARKLSGEDDDDEHLLPQADDDDALLTVDELPTEPSSKARDRMMMKLYVSHTLNCWGDRMWTFAVSLFFIEIWPDYLLVAIYGLSIDVFCTLLGAHAGGLTTSTCCCIHPADALLNQGTLSTSRRACLPSGKHLSRRMR